jgi:hypothetical protein
MTELELRALAQDARDRQGFERSADHMRRPLAVGIVRRLGFEQFRVGEDDAQLIVEAMKESGKIARIQGGRAIFSHGPQREPESFADRT